MILLLAVGCVAPPLEAVDLEVALQAVEVPGRRHGDGEVVTLAWVELRARAIDGGTLRAADETWPMLASPTTEGTWGGWIEAWHPVRIALEQGDRSWCWGADDGCLELPSTPIDAEGPWLTAAEWVREVR